AQGRRGVAIRVVAARLLHDLCARVEDGGLTQDLAVDGLLHEAKGVDVLQLHASAEPVTAARTDRNVGVTAKAPLFEVAIVDADGDEHIPQSPQVGRGSSTRRQIRLPNDLAEWRASAVQLDDGASAEPVQVLASVLFHVHARDAGADHLAVDLEL